MSSTTIAPPRVTVEYPPTRSKPATLLLIDDDAAVRSVLARSLRQIGYAVVESESGEDGLAIIETEGTSFDVVICDTFLGGMNGDETAGRIARVKPDLPLIWISGYPRETDGRVRGLAKRYFIAKPFRVQELSALVHEALARA